MGRYKVIDGSQSKHCCFDCTVVDTSKPEMFRDYVFKNEDGSARFETVCECFDIESANLICEALNAKVN